MADGDLDDLVSRIEAEARKGGFSVDLPVYESAKKDPHRPILCAGSLEAKLAVMGRDLGWQEVKFGEPLIGDAGRRVREAVYTAATGEGPPSTDKRLSAAMEHVLFTNTVPYKPVGNKAYPNPVKERFRPFVEELLVAFWRGDQIITLGTEAFKWYANYADKGAADAFWARDDRYEAGFPCELSATIDGEKRTKPVTVLPLPHPSPLNQTYWPLFPEMLRKRLRAIF